MISTRNQVWLMGLLLAAFTILYCFPFERRPLVTAILLTALFPIQLLLWRLSHGRKAKDFFFCFTLLVVTLFLKHFWRYFDVIFYALSILMAAVLRYRVLMAIGACGIVLELLREHFYESENLEEVAFRYLLFLVSGTLTYLLLREEKRQKEEYQKELVDLKYGIHEMEQEPVARLSSSGQVSRKVDAVLALEESLSAILRLIQRIFKPDTVLLWQYWADKENLKIWNQVGATKELRENLVVSMGEGPVGWTALNKKPFFQQDREEGVNFILRRKNPLIRSFLAVPILEGDRLEGVITLDAGRLNYFAQDAEAAVVSFASQISETIRMARVAQDREEMAFEFQAFYHASKELSFLIDFEEIVRKLRVLCAEIVISDFTTIAILKQGGEEYSAYEWSIPDEGPEVYSGLLNDGRVWISWFMTNREEPLIVSESQLQLHGMPVVRDQEELRDLVTFLAVPMRHQQKCIGALLLASKQKEAFSSHQSRILSILCNQAAVSLENASIIHRMEELAITDGLTGLFNHRFFKESLDREWDRAERLQQPLSLLLMDIDHFKGLNDTFGHQAGDFVLKSLAELLKNNARKIDILARYGGEEFAALLPGIDQKNARKTAERWRKTVQRASFKTQNKSFAVTLSIGFACYPSDSSSKMDLIEKADRALYYAKENGRNQVRHFSDTEQQRSSLFG